MNASLWSSLSAQADEMAASALADISTLPEWEAAYPARHEELFAGLGLSPLPPRCDLRLTEYGTLQGEGYRARKVGYQILPDCWASATIYYPLAAPAKVPGVLYLCGHAANGADHYQAHPIRWARRGYVCLIVDTIEQSDNPGEHHGYNMGLHTAWLALGYSGGGGEIWNSIRALDVLAADPAVDAERLGATGVSGGGTCSFFLAAVDARVKAVASLCGVSTPCDAISNRHLFGHCDCFYPINLGQRDFAEYAALIAPRPALFCNANEDPLFHPTEVAAFVERARRVYALYGQEAACQLTTTPGAHGDHPAFDDAVAEWFDLHLAKEPRPTVPRGPRELSEGETSIFNGQPPEPNHLHLLPHLISPRGTVPLPKTADEWPALRQATVARLRKHLFRPPYTLPKLEMKRDGYWIWKEGTSVPVERGEIGGLPLWVQHVIPAEPTASLYSIANAGETMQQAMAAAAVMVDRKTTLYAGVEPRLSADRWPAAQEPPYHPGSRPAQPRQHLLRAMALVGTSPVRMILEDTLAVVDWLFAQGHCPAGRPLYRQGKGDAGVAALYATVLDERVAGVIVEDAPGSHLNGSPLPGILRLLDLPQAAGLVAPRPVALVNPVYSNWTWPARLYARLGCPKNWVSAVDARDALEQMRRQNTPAV